MPVKLPILDLTRQYKSLAPDIQSAMSAVVESGAFILGPRVAELEGKLRERVGAGAAIGVANGSDALVLALMALGVGPGDEVVTTPYTFFATAGAIARLGARPVFVDVREDFLMDLGRVEAALTPRTKALLPVHLFGLGQDLGPIAPLLERRGIPVVEDAAQAIGARTASGIVGSLGALATLSFYPTKNLGAFGDGGMVFARDPQIGERVRMLRAHGSKDRYHHAMVGINSRLDELQAAILLAKLPHLDAWNGRRREVARAYRERIENPRVILPPDAALAGSAHPEGHVYHQFVIRHPERDRLRSALTEAGIGTSVFYPLPLHLQPCFATLGHHQGDFPMSERLSLESLALPIFPEMTEAEIDMVADAIDRFA